MALAEVRQRFEFTIPSKIPVLFVVAQSRLVEGCCPFAGQFTDDSLVPSLCLFFTNRLPECIRNKRHDLAKDQTPQFLCS
jgi:hypothetical protein